MTGIMSDNAWIQCRKMGHIGALSALLVGLPLLVFGCSKETNQGNNHNPSGEFSFPLAATFDSHGIYLNWPADRLQGVTLAVQRQEGTQELKKIADLALGSSHFFDNAVTDYFIYRYRVSARDNQERVIARSTQAEIQYFSFSISQSVDYSTPPDTYLRPGFQRLIFASLPFYLPITSNQNRTQFKCTTWAITNTYSFCPEQFIFNQVDVSFNNNTEGWITYFIKAVNPNSLEDLSPLPVTFLADFSPPVLTKGNLHYIPANGASPPALKFDQQLLESASTEVIFAFTGDLTPTTERVAVSQLFGYSVSLPVPNATGLITVLVQVSDEAENRTPSISCTLILDGTDRTGPTCP